jgi:integrase/recombinase XerD
VPVPLVARGYSMRWEEFSESFVADVERFLSHTAQPDVLADHYARPVRPGTTTIRRGQLRMIATALVRSSFPVEKLDSLATLVQLENAKAAMRFFLARRGGQPGKLIHQHALLLQTIAKHWVKVSYEHLMALSDLCRRFLTENTGMTEKNQARLRQFDHAGNLDALLNLPQLVFAELARKDDGTVTAAKRAMRALAVELLIHVPMRISNLAGIETSRHLVPIRTRSAVTVHLVIPGEETKNGVPIEMQLPVATIELLAIYPERYHPRLAPGGSNWLFPGVKGERCSRIAFGLALSKFVRRETGLVMNPHLFRHLAVKLHLDAHPDDHGTTQRLLGHKNGATTQKYYEGFQTASAFRRFCGVIGDLRARAAGSCPHRPAEGLVRTPGQLATDRILPLAAWPVVDQAAWQAALQPGDVLDPGGLATSWRPVTRANVVKGYGAWLNWLQETGRLDPSVAPATRVTREQVALYLADLQGKAGYTVASRLHELGSAMQAMAPLMDWRWLLRASGRIRGQAVSAKDKRSRLRSPEELMELGIQLMTEAALATAWSPVEQAIGYRDGLMIALLAYRPVRLKNLASIVPGQHLVQRGEEWWLQFPAEETKTRQVIDGPFPANLAPWLEAYLAVFRPVLVAGGEKRGRPPTAALLVSKDGRALSPITITDTIKQRTAAVFGVSVCPHLFRDCAATGIAVSAPDQVKMIPALLAHRTTTTAERHYIQAGSLEAGRRHAQTIQMYRRQAKQVARLNQPRQR